MHQSKGTSIAAWQRALNASQYREMRRLKVSLQGREHSSTGGIYNSIVSRPRQLLRQSIFGTCEVLEMSMGRHLWRAMSAQTCVKNLMKVCRALKVFRDDTRTSSTASACTRYHHDACQNTTASECNQQPCQQWDTMVVLFLSPQTS